MRSCWILAMVVVLVGAAPAPRARITVSVAADRDVPARIAAAQKPPDDEHVRVIAKRGDIDVAHAPVLATYVSTKPKPTSEVLLVSDGYDEPVFARWCYGAGTAAVWTSAIEGEPVFWAQVVRSTIDHRSACR